MSAIDMARSLLSRAVFVLAEILESSLAVKFNFVWFWLLVWLFFRVVCLFVEDKRIYEQSE